MLDTLTGLPDRISTSRLIKFRVEEEDLITDSDADTNLGALMDGQLVLWRASTGPALLRVHLVMQFEFVEG